MSSDPIARAERWRQFYEESGGLRDMLSEIRAAYLTRMAEVEPWETGKLSKLSIAHKVAGQLDNFVMGIIADGAVELRSREHAQRIADLPERKRRWIDSFKGSL